VPVEIRPPILLSKFFKRILIRNIALPLILCFVSASLFLTALYWFKKSTLQVRQTEVVIGKAQTLFTLILDSETGLRGYTIARDKIFLEPYMVASSRIPSVYAELRVSVSDNQFQKEKLDQAFDSYKLWHNSSLESIEQVEHSAILKSVNLRKPLMDEIRARFDTFIKTEEGLRVERAARQNELARFLILSVILLTGGAGALLAHYGRRQLSKKQLGEIQKVLIERDRALNEAEEAVASRDEFISIASHELKTPLSGLLLQLDLMELELKRKSVKGIPVSPDKIEEKVFSGIALCKSQGLKLRNLLNELLDLTKIRVGKMQLEKTTCDISEIAKEVVKRLEAFAKDEGLKINVICEDSVSGNWDKGRIDQVITNLLSNALKYGESKDIHLSVRKDLVSSCAIICVKDQGMGIPPNLQEKIFRRFERGLSTKKISGLGLGLYITSEIVYAHSGRIHLDSEIGKGSTFTVELPLYLEEGSSVQAESINYGG